MPPKKDAKAAQKKAEEKTFGMKNKNKSKKVANYMAQAQGNQHEDKGKKAKDKARAEQDALDAMLTLGRIRSLSPAQHAALAQKVEAVKAPVGKGAKVRAAKQAKAAADAQAAKDAPAPARRSHRAGEHIRQ